METRATFKIDDIAKGTYICDKIRYGTSKDGHEYACIDFDNNKTTFVQSFNINAIKNIIAHVEDKPTKVTFIKYITTTGKEYTRFKFKYGD